MSYTPTTEEVRNRYLSEVFPEDEAEFDRWLAEHDRELSERVWQNGFAKGARRNIDGNPYRKGEK